MYHMTYLLASILAIGYPFLYGMLLVDVFTRSAALVNILKSITTNKSQLLYTFSLILMTVYVFSIFGFIKFADDYVDSADTV